MSRRQSFLVALALSSMLTGAEQATTLPVTAAASINDMNLAIQRITTLQRRNLILVRNSSLVELDAMLPALASNGDTHGAAAVRSSMQVIVDALSHDADPVIVDASAGTSTAPTIIGIWMLRDGAQDAPGRFIEVLDDGTCRVLPMTMCQGLRQIMSQRFVFNRVLLAP